MLGPKHERVVASRVDIAKIIGIVAEAAEIPADVVRGKNRQAENVRARHLAMFAAWKLTGQSLPVIARAFGGRHHTSVLHAIRQIAKHGQKAIEDVEEIRQALEGYGSTGK